MHVQNSKGIALLRTLFQVGRRTKEKKHSIVIFYSIIIRIHLLTHITD